MGTWETVACCDDCWWNQGGSSVSPSWLKASGISEPLTPNGRGITDSGGVRLPMRFRQEMRVEEYCHFCGWTTYSGIYIRQNIVARHAAPLRIRKERT